MDFNEIYTFINVSLRDEIEINEKVISHFYNLSEDEKNKLIYEKLLPTYQNNPVYNKLENLFPDFLKENFDFEITNLDDYEISFIHGNNVGKRILEDLSNIKQNKEIYIISPYLGGNYMKNNISNLIEKNIKINLLTNNDKINHTFFKSILHKGDNDKYWINDININNTTIKGTEIFKNKLFNFFIFCDDKKIHHKIYIIDDILYIGSANYTETGFFKNFETIVRIKLKNNFSERNIIEKYKNSFNIFTKKYNNLSLCIFNDLIQIGTIFGIE